MASLFFEKKVKKNLQVLFIMLIFVSTKGNRYENT